MDFKVFRLWIIAFRICYFQQQINELKRKNAELQDVVDRYETGEKIKNAVKKRKLEDDDICESTQVFENECWNQIGSGDFGGDSDDSDEPKKT